MALLQIGKYVAAKKLPNIHYCKVVNEISQSPLSLYVIQPKSAGRQGEDRIYTFPRQECGVGVPLAKGLIKSLVSKLYWVCTIKEVSDG